MSKFKIGDRVAVYSRHERMGGIVTQTGGKSGLIEVELDGGPRTDQFQWFNPKQCRRIRNKKPLVYWGVVDSANNSILDAYNGREYADRHLTRDDSRKLVVVKLKVVK